MKKHKFLKFAVIGVTSLIALYGVIFGIDFVRFMTSEDEHIKPIVCLDSYSCKCGETQWDNGIFYGFHYSYEILENDRMHSKYLEFLGVKLYKEEF